MKRIGYTNSRKHGFTIVELLIVIVVVGVLVTIVAVSYSGLTNNARVVALKSDLASAASQLELALWRNETYPATLEEANLPASEGTEYQYSYNPSDHSYCLTGVNDAKESWYLNTESSTPRKGGCPGHGQNGIAAITNFARDPTASSNINYFGFSGTPATNTRTISTERAHHGSTSLKIVASASGQLGAAARVVSQSIRVNAGQSMRWSFWMYSTKAGSILPYSDATKVSDGTYAGCNGGVAVPIPANTWTKVIGICTPTLDIYPTQAGGYNLSVASGDTLYFDEFMITKDVTTIPAYADGDSPNWVWNGTPNASSSTGPVL